MDQTVYVITLGQHEKNPSFLIEFFIFLNCNNIISFQLSVDEINKLYKFYNKHCAEIHQCVRSETQLRSTPEIKRSVFTQNIVKL